MANETKTRRPQYRRSPVWDYFEMDDNDPEIVQCLLCDSRLRYVGSTTSGMRAHIQKKHTELVSHVLGGCEQQTPEVKSSRESTPQHDHSFSEKNSSGNGTNKLFEMCVNDLRPIRIVDGEGFREFVHELNPDFVIPSSITLAAMIQSTYWKAQDQTKQQLQDVDHVSLNIEHWTRANSSGHVCITVTAFFINDGWNVEPAVLLTRELPERFGADELADVIKSCLSQYDISEEKVTGIIHDNSPHMMSMCSKLDWRNICCVGSALSSAIKTALELPAIKQILVACRKIVAAFNESPKLQDLLEKYQKNEGLSPARLVQDDPANLNSLFDLIECIALHRVCINAVITELKQESKERIHNFKPDVWDTIMELKLLCALLKRTSNVVMGSEYVSASLVLPVINGLMTKSSLAQNSENPDSVIESFKTTIKEELGRRFVTSKENGLGDNLHLLASVLDPRFKTLRFVDTVQKQTTKNTVLRMLGELHEKEIPKEEEGTTDEPPSKRAKLSDDISFLVGDDSDNEEVVGNLSAIGELEAFMTMPVLNNADNPLEWWRIYQKKFPQLSKLARRYLCMPASTFPIGTNAIESDDSDFVKKRCMLESETTDPLIFLNRNFRSQFHVDLLSNNHPKNYPNTRLANTPNIQPVVKIKREVLR